jgi:hypothetical protein
MKIKALAAKSLSVATAGGTSSKFSFRDSNGRIDPRWLRPMSPAQVRNMMQHSSD